MTKPILKGTLAPAGNVPGLVPPSQPDAEETAWTFRAADYPADERTAAWKQAIDRLRFSLAALDETSPLRGKIQYRASPLGMEFTVVEGASMVFAGQATSRRDAIWLALSLRGEAVLADDADECDIHPGDLAYGPTGGDATLRFPGRFRALLITAPKVSLNPRILIPLSLNLGHLPGSDGIHSVFSGMLSNLADVLMDVKDHQLRPVELAIPEFLLTSLEAEKIAFGLGGNAGAKASHFHRVCQDIEANLSDPDLSLKVVAQMSGASMRYIQKLFAGAGTGFSNYIRTRRLERCRQDLGSPIHADLSISEICFRWGFNGTAHFSRSFKAQYGMTPRDYRRSVLPDANGEDGH
ncbi:MAG: helix-turn-helix domain-containing protein [Pseudomonadota bacterium]